MNREEARIAEDIAYSLRRIANALEKKRPMVELQRDYVAEQRELSTRHPGGGYCEGQEERFGR